MEISLISISLHFKIFVSHQKQIMFIDFSSNLTRLDIINWKLSLGAERETGIIWNENPNAIGQFRYKADKNKAAFARKPYMKLTQSSVTPVNIKLETESATSGLSLQYGRVYENTDAFDPVVTDGGALSIIMK